jgi:hypothetical protein
MRNAPMLGASTHFTTRSLTEDSGLVVTKAKGAKVELVSLSVWLERFTNFVKTMHRFFTAKCGTHLVTDMVSFRSRILELIHNYPGDYCIRELAISGQEKARYTGYLL